MRWSELEAFGSALYRSHVGLSSSSPLNAQIYDDCTSITHFALFASIFAELAPYREKLMQEAHEHGWPLIRPMAAYFGYDEVCWELTAQYMFGPDFLVAPVLDPATSPVQTRGSAGSQCSRLKHRSSTSTGLSDNATADSTTGIGSAHEKLGCTAADFACWGIATVKVYLPRHSEWVHLWSGAQVSGGAHGRYVSVQAPVAAPPVFFRPGSESGHALREFVLRRGMGVCVRTSRSSGRDPGSVSGPVSSDSAECAQVGLNDTGVMHRHATTIAEIVDHVDRDWYDWLGIKQYAAANIYI